MLDNVRLTPGKILLWFFNFLCTGFFLGTLTLLGPVRWTVTYARSQGWAQGAETAAVLFFIALLAGVSFLLARLLSARQAGTSGMARALLLCAPPLAALAALWAWLTPALMTGHQARESGIKLASAEFVFGAYPEEPRLRELKADGYTAVISLLSPAVVPFEPVLLTREKAAAAAAGIELVHIPMLPWVSSNDGVPARLTELAARGPGKYFVHCYLGKDRVSVFRKLLFAAGGMGPAGRMPGTGRSMEDRAAFERGAITRLGRDIYFTPYPTDEEFFAYVIGGGAASLVSLLDPANPENLPWMKKEKETAEKYGLKFVNYPWTALDAPARKEAARAIRRLPRPAVVHAFLSKAPESADFIATYRGEKPFLSFLSGD